MHLKPAHIEGRDFANINLSPPKTSSTGARQAQDLFNSDARDLFNSN